MHSIEEFNRERNEALLSLDETKIRDMVRKFNDVEMPEHPKVFWGAVHKAITGCMSLPLDFRRESKAWLDANGLQSHDDGELSSANTSVSGPCPPAGSTNTNQRGGG